MSQDATTTKDLMKVLEDGKNGFAKAAEKLQGLDRPDLADTFLRYAQQRQQFSTELEQLAAAYGDDIDESGSILAAAHRGWMTVKDAFAGSDPSGVLDTAEQGEDYAVETYTTALEQDLSEGLRSTVQRQFVDIRAAHDEVRALRDAVA